MIEVLTKSKALRPSAVDTIDKVNEIIEVVNSLNPTDIANIKEKIKTIEAEQLTQNSDINSNTSDINSIKQTLYTPLSQEN